MNEQKVVRLEVDDGHFVQVININDNKRFVLVLPVKIGTITFYDAKGNVVEYLKHT